MLKKKIALVTGVNGFIGSHLSLSLIKKDIYVIGMSHSKILPYNIKEYNLQNFTQVVGDIRNYRLLKETFEEYKPDYCIHLAAKATVEEGQSSPFETYDININGAVNILELSRRYKLEKIIIASTSHVYGDNPNVPYKEEYFPRPSRPYETSKTCVDLIAQSYVDTYNTPIEIPRFVNIYGPGDLNYSRLIPKVMRQIITGEEVEIWGGEVIRDYIYIDDVVNAYLCLIERRSDGKSKIVNFGSGRALSVKDLVKKIIKISGKKVRIKIVGREKRSQEIEKQYLSFDKAYKNFHWRAKISFAEGLDRTYKWYKQFLSF